MLLNKIMDKIMETSCKHVSDIIDAIQTIFGFRCYEIQYISIHVVGGHETVDMTYDSGLMDTYTMWLRATCDEYGYDYDNMEYDDILCTYMYDNDKHVLHLYVEICD